MNNNMQNDTIMISDMQELNGRVEALVWFCNQAFRGKSLDEIWSDCPYSAWRLWFAKCALPPKAQKQLACRFTGIVFRYVAKEHPNLAKYVDAITPENIVEAQTAVRNEGPYQPIAALAAIEAALQGDLLGAAGQAAALAIPTDSTFETAWDGLNECADFTWKVVQQVRARNKAKSLEVTHMACGHTANGKTENGEPCCVICFGIHPGADQVVEPPDLAGREAECPCCGKITSSMNGKIPFFRHRPEKERDEFYCGCMGWD